MSRAANELCLDAHLVAERGRDMDATPATLHPDCRFVTEPLGLRLEGKDSTLLRRLVRTASDLQDVRS